MRQYEFPRKTPDDWTTWPRGEWAHNVNPEKRTCPVCWKPLRTVKVVYEDVDIYWESGKCVHVDLWDLVCPHCRTQYVARLIRGTAKVQSVDPRDDRIKELEAQSQHQSRHIQQLEGRIARLEAAVVKLMNEQRPQTPPPADSSPKKPNDDRPSDDDLTNRYGYLIN